MVTSNIFYLFARVLIYGNTKYLKMKFVVIKNKLF